MNISDLLEISFYLSILTFYLGTLVYALPIPITGLKRWGPRLISDAFYVASLTLMFYTILNAAKYIANVLGANWLSFYGFLTGQIAGQLSLVFGLTTLTKFVNPKLAPIVSKIVSSLVSKLLTSIYITSFLYVLGLVIQKSYAALAALGIVLMSVPFRIARGAGAFLLAFSLVFYVALPLYPQFFSYIVIPPSNEVKVFTYNPIMMTKGIDTYTYIDSIDVGIWMQIPVSPSSPPDIISKAISFIARLVYAVIIAAALYLTMLISMTVGLARALGGFSRLRVI